MIIDATGDADVPVRAGVEYVQDIPTAALNATLLFRVGGVDAEMFMADIQRTPEKITLLADPYLRNVQRLRSDRVLRGSRYGVHDCPYIYLDNFVRDYVPRREWAEWEITGEDKASGGVCGRLAAGSALCRCRIGTTRSR